MEVSTSGLKAQTKRISVVSQNIANAESSGSVPGAQPYRRKVIFLDFAKDRSRGIDIVKVKKVDRDPSAYKVKFDPHHPAANDQGYVLYPNVDRTLEAMDAREAQRSYEANMSMYEISKNMEMRTLDILR
ncbi:MAG: flagellar basal body rod protein FlgC [Alphaproteobacteria bacterium 33-17]|nr:MAG: flagellar basal body rod protein FlgC [Alphaproteobacteria bacterium 33-17]